MNIPIGNTPTGNISAGNIAIGKTAFALPEMPTGQIGPSAPGNFADAMASAINHVEAAQNLARSAAGDLLTAGKGDVHTVALAFQRADLSLELFQQVRNKFVQAYQEIMRMPM